VAEPQLVMSDGDDVLFTARITATHDGRTLARRAFALFHCSSRAVLLVPV